MKRIAKADYLPNLKEVQGFFDDHAQEYDEEKISTKARDDAAHGIPTLNDDTFAPFEQELTHAAATLSSKVAAAFRGALEILDAKIKAEQEKAERALEDQLKVIDLEYGIDADAVENTFGLQDAHKQYEQAENRYTEMYNKFQRQPIHYVPHWLYVIFATLIFLGEIPLNALVFQIFGENQVMTWVMAFIIGLSIPLTAHFIGIKLREHGDGFSWGNASKGVAAFAMITAALYGLSIMRQTYLHEYKGELGLTDALVESSFLFFWLNMAVFGTAIFIAYLAHDSVAGYEGAEYDQKKTRKIVERMEKRRVTDLVKLGKKRALALAKTHSEFREQMIDAVMLKGVYDQVLNEGKEWESRCLHRLWQNIAVYRNENLRARDGNESPQSFKEKPDFPLALSAMAEKLHNDKERSDNHASS